MLIDCFQQCLQELVYSHWLCLRAFLEWRLTHSVKIIINERSGGGGGGGYYRCFLAATLVEKNKSFPFRLELNSFVIQILPKRFYHFFWHRHGRLVTWSQIKNTGKLTEK